MQRRESNCGGDFLDQQANPVVYGNGLFLSWTGLPNRVRFEEDPTPPTPPPPEPPPTPPEPPTPPVDKRFTQADLDRVVAKQRREMTEKHLEEVNRMKKAVGLSDEERSRLEKRSTELEDALLSEKDRAKKEIERIKKELSEQSNSFKTEAQKNWNLYTGSLISTEISTAAAKHKAFNPEQVAAIVRPLCTVEDEKDEKLKPTGKHLVRVKTSTVDPKTGVAEEQSFTVDKYIEQLREKEDSANLFLSERAGGQGYRPGTKGGDGEKTGLSSTQKIAEGLRQQKGGG